MTDKVVRIGANDWRDMLIVELERSGGDPSHLFELLEAIIRDDNWRTIADEDGRPFPTLRALIEAPQSQGGCGQNADKVMRLIEIEHRFERVDNSWRERMHALRQALRAALSAEPLAEHGEIGRGRSNGDKSLYINSNDAGTQGGTSSTYTIRRLKRDAPELADAVLSGELSANQAAIQAGFRNPTMTVYLDDMSKNARKLAHLLERDQVLELIDRLYNEVS